MQSRSALVSFLMALLLFACDENRVYDEYQSVPDVWNKNQVINFNVKVLDNVDITTIVYYSDNLVIIRSALK